MSDEKAERTPKFAEIVEPVSDYQLGRFLRSLAGIYRDKPTGNLSLSLALSKLADRLTEGTREDRSLPRYAPGENVAAFRELSLEAVLSFIEDESKTKAELLDMASARFALPRGNLTKMRIAEIRDAIRSAISRERSLDVIAHEASRQGANRRT